MASSKQPKRFVKHGKKFLDSRLLSETDTEPISSSNLMNSIFIWILLTMFIFVSLFR